jgi:uncharacterized protein with NAD-binding domain and iron-sulfur cluster
MAGLAAAWRLSEPDLQGHVEVTVYQRGWRLGGKAASSRGVHGRIEEHGLHVWLGYYDNAFRLIRDCYALLDRERTDPGCPIRSWRDAFVPASDVGVTDVAGAQWLASFPENDLVPGDPHPSLDPAELAGRSLALAESFLRSVTPDRPVRAALTARPEPPRFGLNDALADLSGPIATAGIATALELLRLAPGNGGRSTGDDTGRRTVQFLDLVLTMARGIAVDRLAVRGWSSIDHLDFREWLARHGAGARTLESPIIRGLYDLVFAYEGGDSARPSFPAGLGLHLSGKIFFDYRGAIFWKTRAGLGDVAVAPLYLALQRRGVRFELFHRLDAVHLDETGEAVAAVSLGRQATLREGLDGYDPLVRVKGLPVFPSAPRWDQLHPRHGPASDDLESHWCRGPDAASVRLEAGRHFDAVVLAVSIGMVPYACAELVEKKPAWRDMVDGVGTVATRAAQVWFQADQDAIGSPPGATVSASDPPFETWSSMTHTIEHEDWPAHDQPATAASLCGVLPDAQVPADDGRTDVAAVATADLATDLGAFLEGGAGGRWAAAHDQFEPRPEHRYWRANVDPSDRYVQALPGSDRYRLRADGSGCFNLFLAGDWIDSGLNAGCIEAAVVSGLQAGNAVLGRPLAEGVIEFHPRTAAGR